MTDSLELYKEALTFARSNPTPGYGFRTFADDALKNFYLQLVTTTFYELTTRKTSPLLSALCQMNQINHAPKNFSNLPAQQIFTLPTSFDLYLIVYGLNVALAENLGSCLKVFEGNAANIFRGQSLRNENFQTLIQLLKALDESLEKFHATEKVVEKIIEKRVEVPAEKKSPALDEEDKKFLQSLDALAENRKTADEKILTEIKNVQLSLQDELPRLQETLKKILEIREEIEYKSTEEPIRQLIGLFDKLYETAQQHPQEDAQRGYEKLVKRCKNFPRYVEQALAMLGAKLINETGVPFDPAKHEATNAARPSYSAKVSKILRVGLTYKGQVRRKAEVEISEPSFTQENYLATRKSFLGGKFL